MDIKVPFLKEEVGLGDLIKEELDAVGIHQKPGKKGCRCKKRQAKANAIRLVPRKHPKET